MPTFSLPFPEERKRITGLLKAYLNPAALRSFLTKTSSDRGKERYRRASITASTSFLSKALTILISFASVPLTVNYLGPERYGVWLTISSLLTWMTMTDFGLAGNALVNVLSEAHGNDNKKLAREYTSSAFWALTGIAVVIGAGFAVGFTWIPWRSVFRVSEALPTAELTQTCALTLIIFLLGLPLSVQNSIYSAYQDGFVANMWGVVSNVLALVSLVVVSHFKGGLPSLVIALSGTRTLVIVANVYFLFFRRYKWLTPVPSAVRWDHIKRLFKLGGKYMVTQLASFGIYQSQPMIITQMLGPASVMVYVVTYKVIALPVDLIYLATAPFISAFGEARARNDWNWIKGAYRNATLASIAFGVPLMAVIAVICKPVIRVWAGADAVPSNSLILWLTVYTLVAIGLMAGTQMLSGLERVNALALSIGLCSISVVGLAILFSQWWGLSGIAFAMALSKVVTFWPIQTLEIRRALRSATAKAAAVLDQLRVA